MCIAAVNSGGATFLFETRGWQLSSKGAAGFYKQQLFLMMPARRRDPDASGIIRWAGHMGAKKSDLKFKI